MRLYSQPSAETLLRLCTGRLGTPFQRYLVRYSPEEQFGHPQADAPSVQTVEHFSSLQLAYHAPQNSQHRAVEAILPSTQKSTLDQSGFQTEFNPLSCHPVPPPHLELAELLL